MKADISTDGHLTITPENETESYALKKWWADFHGTWKSEGEPKATLSILTHKQGQAVIEIDVPLDEKI